MADCRQP